MYVKNSTHVLITYRQKKKGDTSPIANHFAGSEMAQLTPERLSRSMNWSVKTKFSSGKTSPPMF